VVKKRRGDIYICFCMQLEKEGTQHTAAYFTERAVKYEHLGVIAARCFQRKQASFIFDIFASTPQLKSPLQETKVWREADSKDQRMQCSNYFERYRIFHEQNAQVRLRTNTGMHDRRGYQ
jgi:hypothetical protein